MHHALLRAYQWDMAAAYRACALSRERYIARMLNQSGVLGGAEIRWYLHNNRDPNSITSLTALSISPRLAMSGILHRVSALWRQVGGQAGRSLLNQGGGARVTSSSTLGNSSQSTGYFAKVCRL